MPNSCDLMDCSPPASSVHGISQPEYWSGLPFPFPGDLPDPGIEPRSPALQADSLSTEPPGKISHVDRGYLLEEWPFTSMEPTLQIHNPRQKEKKKNHHQTNPKWGTFFKYLSGIPLKCQVHQNTREVWEAFIVQEPNETFWLNLTWYLRWDSGGGKGHQGKTKEIRMKYGV